MHGARVLLIDLTTRNARFEPLSEDYRRDYLGCVGIATRLLWDNSVSRMEPLDPANPIVFAPGAFVGTMVPAANKYAVATKSPLTGFIGDSLSSGDWALALKRSGCDGLVVTGAASELSYLLIDQGRVYFRPAGHLTGLSPRETEKRIRQELVDGSISVASIGPAGEDLVRYACVSNDFTRQAGRTGVGAVMGSKRLKAIALRGSGTIGVADATGLEQRSQALIRRSQESVTEKYRTFGTAANVLALNRLAALPTRNFQESTFEDAEGVSGEYLHSRHLARVIACAGCSIACDHLYRVVEGIYAGTEASLDYESLYALGPLCGVGDAATVLRAAELCDSYGLDSMSTGVCIAWAMECAEKGLLKPWRADGFGLNGLELAFGNGAALVAMVEQIGRREGLGRLLGEGVKKAAEVVGGGSEHWAMHVKGLELPGYEPRSLKTLALGLAVATRGACHNRSAAYEVDLSNRVDRFSADAERGRLAMEQEDFAATLDSLGICKFLRRCFADFYAETAELFSLTTGVSLTPDGLRTVGERVCNLKKAFNIREGWKRSDDWLPMRVFREALPTGIAAGVRLTEEELEMMVTSYYEARGWTQQGLIPEEKLKALGLGELAPALQDAVAHQTAAGEAVR